MFDAKVSITDPALKDAQIIFKTLSLGKAIEAIELSKTNTERNYQLKLPGTFDYAEEEVIAVLMPKDSTSKQKVISNFRLVHLSPKTVNVSLVPLDANSQSKLQAQGKKINQIYNKIGVSFTVKEEPVLDISNIVSGNTIGSEDADLMSTYSPQQQQINALFKTTYDRYVLFVTDKTSSTGQNGYMRQNGQFGYVYNNAPQKTGAHELGHGVFKLEHPWKAYQTTKGATDLLMDYSTGEELSHLDWKQVNDPAFKLYTFQGQSSGEFTDIQLTPEWEPFKFTGSSIYISGPVKSPNGAVHGIAMCKNDNCTEKENYFWINDGTKKGYYANGKSSPLAITYLNQQEKDKNPAITLFWNYGSCGYNKTYSTSWNYIKDKKGFDLTKVTDANTISYKETVPCADGSGSSVSSDDMCVGKDVVAINQGYNNVLGVLDSNDKTVIVETIKNAEDCSLRLLSYTQIEKLIKKLGYDSTIKDDQESAIVRLAASIKTEDFKTFYALLEKNNNELIKNLVSHLQDRIVVYGGSNYTGFVSVLVQMFNKYPASIADRWPTDTDGFAKRVINLNPVDYTKDTTSSPWIQTFTSKHNDGSYISGTGDIRVNDVYTTTAYINGNYSSVDKEEEITVVSPLTPIIIIPNKDKVPLIQSAIDGYDFGNANYIVPAILLKYNKDKIHNDYIEKSVMTALDLATIYASGGTALATKVTWVRRAWALAEVAGAVGNIAVNTQTVDPDSNLGKAINAYNLGMGIIGVKNLSVGGYKFVSNLPQATRTLLQENKGLRDLLVAKYIEWKTLTTNVDNLSDAEKQIITGQEGVWKSLLKTLPESSYLYNPNMANKVRQVVLDSGESMEKFVNINYKAANGLASADEISWLQNFVTKNFPNPKVGDNLRKVMPEEDFVKYYRDAKKPAMSRGAGFITKAEDYVIPKSSEELIENLRLDYSGTKFSKDKGFVAIEYKNPSTNVIHPFNRSKIEDDLPYTNTGMTGSKHNIIPEYYSAEIVEFGIDDIARVYDKDGKVIEIYKIVEDKLSKEKIWEKQ